MDIAQERTRLDARASAAWIARHAKDVRVDQATIASIAPQVLQDMRSSQYLTTNKWTEHELHPSPSDAPRAASWVFLVDTLNFSFWHDAREGGVFGVELGGKVHTGYWALCAAVNRALGDGVPVLEPSFLVSASDDQLRHVFRSDTGTPIPLLEERVRVMRQAGQGLVDHFQGSVTNLITQAHHSCESLIALTLAHFPSFRDHGVFDGQAVAFHKRVQIFVADLWGCFAGQGLGHFSDIHKLTMFADYRVPQILGAWGMLAYSDALLARLQRGEVLESMSREEMEIRGCSIHAVECLRDELAKCIARGQEQGQGEQRPEAPNAILVDFFLWDTAKDRQDAVKHFPIHHTRSVFY